MKKWNSSDVNINERKSLNILALGDAHFKNNCIPEVNIYLEKLENFIRENTDAIDYICILGDTLDDHAKIHTAPLNKAVQYIKLVSSYKETFILVGNHDYIHNNIFLQDDHWINAFKHWKGVTVVDKPLHLFLKNSSVVFCPYVFDGRFIEALDTIGREKWMNSQCIFGHQLIKGVEFGSIIAKDADEWKDEYPLLVSGHIHNPQWIGKKCYYAGSIMQVAVNEDYNKSICLVQIPPLYREGKNKESVIISTIDLKLPKKIILNLDFSQIEDFEMPPVEENEKYMIYISGTVENFASFKKTLKYRELLKSENLLKNGIKFKPISMKQDKKDDSSGERIRAEISTFNSILEQSIDKTQNYLVRKFYNEIILGKKYSGTETEFIFIDDEDEEENRKDKEDKEDKNEAKSEE